jgi:hypothetical protein
LNDVHQSEWLPDKSCLQAPCTPYNLSIAIHAFAEEHEYEEMRRASEIFCDVTQSQNVSIEMMHRRSASEKRDAGYDHRTYMLSEEIVTSREVVTERDEICSKLIQTTKEEPAPGIYGALGLKVSVSYTETIEEIVKVQHVDIVSETSIVKKDAYADWLGILKDVMPYSQQLFGADHLLQLRNLALLYDMRVGKTLTVILAAKLLQDRGLLTCVLVVCPVPIMEAVWSTQLKQQGFHPLVLGGTPEEDEADLTWVGVPASEGGYDAVICSYEGTYRRADMILENIDPSSTMVIVDESSKIKNPIAQRTRGVRTLTYSCEYVTVLSGSPMSNGPQDIWSQMYIVDRGIRLGASFNNFMNDYLYQNRAGRWLVRPGEKCVRFEMALHSASSRMIASEADQFNGRAEAIRYISLPPSQEQVVATNDVIDGIVKLASESDDVRYIKAHLLTQMGYLREICCGYNKAQLEEGGPYSRWRFSYDPKTLWLEAFLAGNPGVPVVCYTEYNEQEQIVCDMLRRTGTSYLCLSQMRGTPSSRGAELQEAFQSGEIRVAVLKPIQCYGLALNRIPAVKDSRGAFPVIIYMSLTWALDPFTQSKARCLGTWEGKSITTTIYYLTIRNSIEEKIIEAIKRKQWSSDSLLKDDSRQGYVNLAEELRLMPDDVPSDDMFDPQEMAARLILKIGPNFRPTWKRIEKACPGYLDNRYMLDMNAANIQHLSDSQYRRYMEVKSAMYLHDKFDEKGYAVK